MSEMDLVHCKYIFYVPERSFMHLNSFLLILFWMGERGGGNSEVMFLYRTRGGGGVGGGVGSSVVK
jgi:hypothetical protein